MGHIRSCAWVYLTLRAYDVSLILLSQIANIQTFYETCYLLLDHLWHFDHILCNSWYFHIIHDLDCLLIFNFKQLTSENVCLIHF